MISRSLRTAMTVGVVVATAFAAQADDKTITEKTRETANAVVEKTKEIARDTKDVVVGAAVIRF